MDTKIKTEPISDSSSSSKCCHPSVDKPQKRKVQENTRDFKRLQCGCCENNIYIKKGRKGEGFCSEDCYMADQIDFLEKESARKDDLLKQKDEELAQLRAQLGQQEVVNDDVFTGIPQRNPPVPGVQIPQDCKHLANEGSPDADSIKVEFG